MLVSKAIATAMGISLSVTNDDYEKAATDYGLDFSAQYVAPGNTNGVNAAAASILCNYLMINSLGEGGFSISLNVDNIRRRILWLAKNSGGLFTPPNDLLVTKRRVRAISRW